HGCLVPAGRGPTVRLASIESSPVRSLEEQLSDHVEMLLQPVTVCSHPPETNGFVQSVDTCSKSEQRLDPQRSGWGCRFSRRETSNPVGNVKDTAWTIRYRPSPSLERPREGGSKMTGTRFSAASAALAFAACLALGSGASADDEDEATAVVRTENGPIRGTITPTTI